MESTYGVRDLFLEVGETIGQYRRAKPGREATNLARRLANEQALYDQFLRKLPLHSSKASLALEEGVLLNRPEARDAIDCLEEDLEQMKELLRGLKADLAHTSRTTEILVKLRQKPIVSRGILHKHPLQKRLDDLSITNQRLATYSLDGRVPLPVTGDFQALLSFETSFRPHRDGESAEGVQVYCQNFVCDCQEAVSGDGLINRNAPSSGDANTQLRHNSSNEFPKSLEDRFEHVKVSVSESADGAGRTSPRQCPGQSANPTTKRHGGQLYLPARSKRDNSKMTVRLHLREADLPSTATPLEVLLPQRRVEHSQRRRMELAFHLSSAILLLLGSSISSLLENASNWTDWTAAFEPGPGEEAYSLYIRPEFPITKHPFDAAASRKDPFAFLARERGLSLLGSLLIQLAFGRTLAQMRQDDPRLLETKDEDGRLLDLLTSKRLLASRKIGNRFGENFEAVVNVCLNQQYRERKGAAVVELDLKDPSFLERAAVSILLPLYEEMRKNAGCTCNTNRLEKAGLAPAEGKEFLSGDGNEQGDRACEHLSTTRRGDDGEPDNDLSHISPTYFRPGDSTADPVFPAIRIRDQSVMGVGSEDNGHDSGKNEYGSHPSNAEWTTLSRPSAGGVHAIKTTAGKGVHQRGVEPAPGGDLFVKGAPFNQAVASQAAPNIASNDDAESVSLHSVTVTTDSAVTWQTDQPEEPPGMPENHPLSLIQGIAVRVFLAAFHSWRSHGNTAGQATAPGMRTENARKRARDQSSKDRPDEDMEESPSGPTQGVGTKKRRVQESNITFACPYFKKDGLAHRRCCGYVLSRIRDVKQHLVRRHQIPLYCPRCFQTGFGDEDDRDLHVQDSDCRRSLSGKPEGITASQRQQLAKKPPAQQTQEDQWYGIFDLIFPGYQPRPSSPYIDSGVMQNVLEYQTFATTHGPRILDNVLTANGAVTWSLPIGENDRMAFRHRVLEEGIRAMLDEWIGSGGVQPAEPNRLGSSSRGGAAAPNPRQTETPLNLADDDAEGQSVAALSYVTEPSSHLSTADDSWNGDGQLMGSEFSNEVEFGFGAAGGLTPAETDDILDMWSRSLAFQNQGARFQ